MFKRLAAIALLTTANIDSMLDVNTLAQKDKKKYKNRGTFSKGTKRTLGKRSKSIKSRARRLKSKNRRVKNV